MGTIAASGDTWGVDGPSFLLAYVVIAASVWIAGTLVRRSIADGRPHGPVGDLTGHPHDVAYLNGGPELAVYSALASMHLEGTIAPERGSVRAVGRQDRADGLEWAIHFTAAVPVDRKRLQFHRPVVDALAEIDARLVESGLLLSADQRRRVRGVGWWMVGVAGLGLLRLLAGVADAKPVGFLAVVLFVVAVVAVVQLSRTPRRTRLGDRTLAELQRQHHVLAPSMKPDWTTYGPAGAALGVGVFGMSALWASDPAFADEIAAQKATAGGGYSDGGWSGGGGDGGGGGCGG